MKISDLLRLSLDNLKRRKGRTFLTVLGVIIGTCSIVMMISIGVALDKSYDEMLSNMGDLTLIEIYNWSGSGEVDPLTDKVIEGFAGLSNVRVATPVYSPRYMNLVMTSGTNGKYVLNAYNVTGMYREAIESYGYEIAEGRFINSTDKEYSIIMGELTAYQFENSKKQWPNNRIDPTPNENGELPAPFVDIFKDKIKLKATGWSGEGGTEKSIEKDVKVVGKIKQDTSKGYETMYGVIMDLNDVVALEKEYMKANNIKDTNKGKERTYERALVKVTDIKYVDGIVEQIESLGYNTWSSASFRNEMKKQTQVIQLILGGLGSISLLVAAIGIANTMTMAIYERTKEIGVMKVLGCELRDIKNMFLTEAAGIGFLGGVVGIVICFALSAGLNTIGNAMSGGYGSQVYLSIIPSWLVLFGIGFSTLIGILSGYVPAVRAVKITALSAIRHD